MSPFLLITGIFGAGKTTFLRSVLPLLRESGWNPNVILNHHDRAAADAATLGSEAKRIVPIPGGCACCDALGPFLDAVAATPHSDKSVLLAEISAAADTNSFLESIILDPRTAKFAPPVQINIVDAMRWRRRGKPELDHLEGLQVITAPYLVVNRLGDLKNARRQKVESSIGSLNPYAHLIEPADLPSLLSDLTSPDPSDRHFSTLNLPLRSKVARGDLFEFLGSLPREVIRAKGIAQLEDTPDHPVLFEKIDGVKDIYLQDMEPSESPSPILLIIGPNMPAAEIKNSAGSKNLL